MKDRQICDLLNSHDKRGMELLFEVYYKSLVSWANTFLNDLNLAEDVVQEFFIALWNQEIHRDLRPETLSSFCVYSYVIAVIISWESGIFLAVL